MKEKRAEVLVSNFGDAPTDIEVSFFNDVAIARDGTVYYTARKARIGKTA
jgi:hypothetical protein